MIAPKDGALPPTPEALAAQRKARAGGGRTFVRVFSVILLLTAGIAFIFKLIEFAYTATTKGSDALASFLIPVLNYLIIAAGFFCLFIWAYVTGQFRDVEGPKYRMLEMQREIDALEG